MSLTLPVHARDLSGRGALRVPGAAFLLCALVLGSAGAGEFDPVFYELAEGSVLVDDCLDCDRAPIELPLRGGFVMTRLPVRILGELYAMTQIELRWTGVDREVAVRGTGRYHRVNDEIVRVGLEVEIGDASGVLLDSGDAAPGATWPAIDVRVTEPVSDGVRDPLHVYSIRLVAAPHPQAVLYELVEGDTSDFSGSFFIDDCTVCGRPTIPVPVRGRFLLVPVEVGGPNPIDTYHIAALEVDSIRNSPPEYRITGQGTYAIGGEVALLQELELDVVINDISDVLLESDHSSIPDGVRFPMIDASASGPSPVSDIQVFSLHVVAEPAEGSEPSSFRRGDANDDGTVNIADPVFALLWLFAGGGRPPCLDAADGNGDGALNLPDPVFLLDYLFRAGPVPAAPGPIACGRAEPLLGCSWSSACPAP